MFGFNPVNGKKFLYNELPVEQEDHEKYTLDSITVNPKSGNNTADISTVDEWPNGEIEGIDKQQKEVQPVA